jgi:hypothetical protein
VAASSSATPALLVGAQQVLQQRFAHKERSLSEVVHDAHKVDQSEPGRLTQHGQSSDDDKPPPAGFFPSVPVVNEQPIGSEFLRQRDGIGLPWPQDMAAGASRARGR